MLETVRQYARERLDESGGADAPSRAILRFSGVAEKARGLVGPGRIVKASSTASARTCCWRMRATVRKMAPLRVFSWQVP
jgi:hypothetical protein